MKAFLLLTVGALIVYVALTGKSAQVAKVFGDAILGGTNGTPPGNTPGPA